MSDKNPEVAGQSGAVDTHCHLFLMDSEPSGVVEAAKAAGVELPGVDESQILERRLASRLAG